MSKETSIEWLVTKIINVWQNDHEKWVEIPTKVLLEYAEQAAEMHKKECNIPNIISPLTQKQQECKAYMDSFYKKYKKLPSVSNVAEALGIKRTAAHHRIKKVKEYL
jgi:hypothetical protein